MNNNNNSSKQASKQASNNNNNSNQMAPKDKDAVELTADSTSADKKKTNDSSKKNGKPDDPDPPATGLDTLSEEDRELKERLETCVTTLIHANHDEEASVTIPIRLKALEVMITELRTATSSMTSVPKPLKFLRPHFGVLKDLYHSQLAAKRTITTTTTSTPEPEETTEWLQLRARTADVLAVLAMTMGQPHERESLHFKLQSAQAYAQMESAQRKSSSSSSSSSAGSSSSSNDNDNLGSWGHEFVRSLAGEIGQEYQARVLDGADPEQDQPFADLLQMVDAIVPFHITHNAEAEAVDLLIEVQRLKKLLQLEAINEHNYQRICLYLIKTADFMADPDDLVVSNTP